MLCQVIKIFVSISRVGGFLRLCVFSRISPAEMVIIWHLSL